MENSQRNALLSTLGSSEENILQIMTTKGLQVCMRNWGFIICVGKGDWIPLNMHLGIVLKIFYPLVLAGS